MCGTTYQQLPQYNQFENMLQIPNLFSVSVFNNLRNNHLFTNICIREYYLTPTHQNTKLFKYPVHVVVQNTSSFFSMSSLVIS